jgi:DNA invertase Pin-like site-specific DNA recombinase
VLIGTYHGEAVKGSDPIDARPNFAAMLEALEANGTKTIIVETTNRFARDLMVQEVGFAMLRARGIELIAADSPSSFLDDTPTARLIRQVLGAVSEFEKAMLVAKLRGRATANAAWERRSRVASQLPRRSPKPSSLRVG